MKSGGINIPVSTIRDLSSLYIDTWHVKLALRHITNMLGAMNNYDRVDSNLWRHVTVLFLVIGSLVLLMLQAPIKQDLTYHAFVDVRTIFGIPNFFNVISNLPFLLVGMAGSIFCYRKARRDPQTGWLIFFTGIALVGLGSVYYHLDPGNQRLLWDRLPMTIGFMGLFTALLGELIQPRLTRYLLLPSILLGIASVLVWHWYDDLRLYVWVQFMPMLVIPAMLVLYRKRYSHLYLLVLALAFYLLAKLLEAFDAEIFSMLQNEMAGHAIKHVFAAIGSALLLLMLRVRKPIS